MTDLTALIPPFLMAAAVIVAIVAFLRYEMRRARSDRPGRGDGNSGPQRASADNAEDRASSASSSADAAASMRRDG
jgi:hypothetical protein